MTFKDINGEDIIDFDDCKRIAVKDSPSPLVDMGLPVKKRDSYAVLVVKNNGDIFEFEYYNLEEMEQYLMSLGE